jgi:hypothetical protein
MAKKGKKSTTTMHTWAISRIKGTPAVEVGWVDAPDAETAIKEAIERYGITDREQQKRLVARRVCAAGVKIPRDVHEDARDATRTPALNSPVLPERRTKSGTKKGSQKLIGRLDRPRLQRAERMFDRLAASTHCIRIFVQARLHGVDNVLVLPPPPMA